MAVALTLSGFIDETRRLIQVTPPIDFTTPGASGAQPTDDPDPNNNTVIQAINMGIDFINRIVRAGLDQGLTIPTVLPNAYQRGLYYTDVSSVITDPLTAMEITDISWNDGLNVIRLSPLDYYALEKDYTQFQQYFPGRPQFYVVTGSQIGVVPPPSTTGTLIFTGFVTIPQLVNMSDTLSYVPVEYQDTITFWAASILSARDAMDVEAATRLQTFLPMAQQGTLQIYSWKNGFTNTGVADVKEALQMIQAQHFPMDAPQPAAAGGSQ